MAPLPPGPRVERKGPILLLNRNQIRINNRRKSKEKALLLWVLERFSRWRRSPPGPGGSEWVPFYYRKRPESVLVYDPSPSFAAMRSLQLTSEATLRTCHNIMLAAGYGPPSWSAPARYRHRMCVAFFLQCNFRRLRSSLCEATANIQIE